MTQTRSEKMRLLRESRKEQGFVKVEVYIRPEYKKRLASYVNHRLFGECNIRRVRKKKKDEKQIDLNLD